MLPEFLSNAVRSPVMAYHTDSSNLTTDAVPRVNDPALEAYGSLVPSGNYSEEFGAVSLPTSSSVQNYAQYAPTNIVITGSNGVHVGDSKVLTLNIGSETKKPKTKKKRSKKQRPSYIDDLLACQKSVTCAHVRNIRISCWRPVMRHLNISDPDIDNTHEQYSKIAGGLEEVIYQLLRLWVESNGKDATVNKLTEALLLKDEMNALHTLAVAFQIIPADDSS